MYRVPVNYFYRIHHVRPRFKNDVESVLLYVAQECSKLPPSSVKEYAEHLNEAIKLYGDNMSKSEKTINNWRTEIAALFGFYIEDKITGTTKTGDMAKLLSANQDLIQFFKYFLFYFQYPGGHLRSDIVADFIYHGIRFKPAHYLLRVFLEGNKRSRHFYLTKEEATHCIFNDLRVSRDNRAPKEVVKLVLDNRSQRIDYDSSGDVIRYAGDILDYMVLANLLRVEYNRYYLNGYEKETISAFVTSTYFFDGYNEFYGKGYPDISLIRTKESEWFEYVNHKLSESLFSTNIAEFLAEVEAEEHPYKTSVEAKIQSCMSDTELSAKDIGDLGESLVVGHEKMRIIQCGLERFIHLIVKIPTYLGVGYDIQSLEGTPDGLKRYIEVKTTISKNRINFNSFHMTKNEWSSADSLKERYFIYRLMINSSDRVIYIIQNPVRLYKEDKIKMLIDDGANISFTEDVCTKTDLMLWRG